MNIHHRPLFSTGAVIEHYSNKDGVDISYVCTSALGGESRAMDIFYRETPHPDFGNRYFGLYEANDYGGVRGGICITNADVIENTEFSMVEVNSRLHYSQHRHDFYTIDDVSIDGGRAYTRLLGNLNHKMHTLKVRNGEFIHA